jgi:hypothetical protein
VLAAAAAVLGAPPPPVRGAGGGGAGEATAQASHVLVPRGGRSSGAGGATGVTAARRALILSLQQSAEQLEGACGRLTAANASLRRAMVAKSSTVGALEALRRVHQNDGGGSDSGGGGNAGIGTTGSGGNKGDTAAASLPPPPQLHMCGPEYQSTLSTWHRALEAALESFDTLPGHKARDAALPLPPSSSLRPGQHHLESPDPSLAPHQPSGTATPPPQSARVQTGGTGSGHGDDLASGSSAGSLGCVPPSAVAAAAAAASPPPPPHHHRALPVDAAAEKAFRASVVGLFAPSRAAQSVGGGPEASVAAALGGPSSLVAAAAAALSGEAEKMAGEMRGITIEQFGERLKRIVAFASLELDHAGGGDGDDDDDDDDETTPEAAVADNGGDRNQGHDHPDAAPAGSRSSSLAALVREWLLLYAASSKYAPRVVDVSEAYDLQRGRMVSSSPEEEDAAFRRRSRRALEAARLTPQQRHAIADAFAFFQEDTRAPLRDWSRAAGQVDVVLGSASGGDGSAGPLQDNPDASLDLLSGAVARALVARSTHFLSVCGVVTPKQLLRAMVAVYPRALRPVNLGWSALETEQRLMAGAADAAQDHQPPPPEQQQGPMHQ